MSTVKAGAYFQVEWEEPVGYDDFLTIALPSQAPNMQVSYANVYSGSPLKLTPPPKNLEPMKFDISCLRVESCWEKQPLKSYRNYIM